MASETLEDSELNNDDHFFSNLFAARDEDGTIEDDSDSESDIDQPIYDDTEESEEEGEEEITPPGIPIRGTQGLREDLKSKGQDVAHPIRQVLIFMDAIGIDVPLFIDGISWGSEACIRDAKIRSARSSLMTSPELPDILRRWWRPPRTRKSKNKRAKGGKLVMELFAKECCQSVLNRELECIAKFMVSPKGEDIKEETLIGSGFEKMGEEIRTHAPNLWSVMQGLGYTSEQMERNTHKNPDKVRE